MGKNLSPDLIWKRQIFNVFWALRVLYYIFTQFWARRLPLGSADDVIKTLNLNISGLANATEVIDPSMEPARDA